MFVTIIIFVIILGLLVFVHEFGHFITAKRLGVRVDEFGFGFPPRLFGIKFHGTLYSINIIPLGGFVKIKGETGESTSDKDSFSARKAWQRISILAAGVAMNFLLAFLLLSFGFMMGVPQEVSDDDIAGRTVRDVNLVIIAVEESSPADLAGVKPGDRIISIDAQPFQTPDEVASYIQDNKEREMTVTLQRGNKPFELSMAAAVYGDNTSAFLGISSIRAGLVKYNFFESWWRAARAVFNLTVAIVSAFGLIIFNLFKGVGIGNQISGPVGVAVLTGQIAQLGIPYLINFTAMLSINLGILNIIPFPALDGGRILFVFIEKIKGNPVSPKIEGIFHNVGFALLILLIIFITFKDFSQYSIQIFSGLSNLFS